MKNYSNFLNERKLNVYNSTFRIKSLIESGVYDTNLIDEWMKKYDFDEYAHAILISKDKIINKSELDIAKSSSGPKNNRFFDTKNLRRRIFVEKHDGTTYSM